MKSAMGNAFRQILNSKNRVFSSIVQNILPNFNLGFLHSAKTLDGCTTLNQCPVYARSALTLAEVLIVIGIIGIVSSLVLPSLIASNNERIAVTKLKKTYATLNEAHRRAEEAYGPITTWFGKDSTINQYTTRYAERVLEFMNVIKTCGLAEGLGCFASNDSKYLYGSYVPPKNDTSDGYKVILSDGVSIYFYLSNYNFPLGASFAAGTSSNNPLFNVYGQIFVDIDGPNKGANTWGIDLFAFFVTKRGIYPVGSRIDVRGNTDTLFRFNCLQYIFCSAWVIETGNREYLKTDSTGKCPNGTMLGWENTTCK